MRVTWSSADRDVVRGRREPSDGGFTLIELVISVAILGIVAAALTGIVIQHLMVTSRVQTRLNESSDLQFVSTYWQNDVSSIGIRSFTPANADPVPSAKSVWTGPSDFQGCGNTFGAGAQAVVSFAWNRYTGGNTPANAWSTSTERVTYVAVPATAGDYLIKRVWCGTNAVPTSTMARNVTSWSVKCDGAPCGASLPQVVTLTLHLQDKSDPKNTGVANHTGADVTITGERRQAS